MVVVSNNLLKQKKDKVQVATISESYPASIMNASAYKFLKSLSFYEVVDIFLILY